MPSYQALNGRRFLCLPAHKDASPSQPSLWVPWFSSSEAVQLQPQSFVSRGKGFGEARCLPPPSCRAAPCRTTAPSMPRGRQVRRGRPTAPRTTAPSVPRGRSRLKMAAPRGGSGPDSDSDSDSGGEAAARFREAAWDCAKQAAVGAEPRGGEGWRRLGYAHPARRRRPGWRRA